MNLDAQFVRFDGTRHRLMDEMATLDAARLQARPIPGKWSILEIIEHVVVAERAVFLGLPEPSSLVPQARGLGNHVRYALVMLVLRFDVPVRMPSRAMAPRGESDLRAIGAQWDQNHAWLRAVVSHLGPRVGSAAVLAHPISGPLTVRQALRMGQVHTDRHIGQIRQRQRLLA